MKKIISIGILYLFCLSKLFGQEMIESGKKIFEGNCTACHSIGKKLIGPDLKNIDQKYDQEWLIDFIRSSQTMIQNGDKQSLAIYNEYNKLIMPDHFLSNEEIITILDYIKQESASLQTTAIVNPIQRPKSTNISLFRPIYLKKNKWFWGITFGIILSIALTLYLVIWLSNVKNNSSKNPLEDK